MVNGLNKLYLNAGQMKAGTTFLYTCLKPHRNIYFSPEKEIQYLAHRYGSFRSLSDESRVRKAKQIMSIAIKLDRPADRLRHIAQWAADYLRPIETPGWYEDNFKGRRSDQWAADFSNLTCTIDPSGLAEIACLAEDVRVTYCVRDTVARAISHAKFHLRYAGADPDLAHLSDADLRKLLLSDNVLPQSRTADHVRNLLSVFGPDRFRIIRCESMWNNPQKVLSQVCDFLEISRPSDEIKTQAVNVGPKTSMDERIQSVFEEVFADLAAIQAKVLDEHSAITIG